MSAALITPQALLDLDALHQEGTVLVDCRYVLGAADAGREQYLAGHIPGAHYLDLERDLSGETGRHGGRHPLPPPQAFAHRLAELGIDQQTRVVAYDDSRLAFAARLWWMMRSLGYRPPDLLDGGLSAYLAAGGDTQMQVPRPTPCPAVAVAHYRGYCDREGLLQAQARGALVVDSRETRRYEGLEEPIDPVAGHIPGAVSRPWQGVTDVSGAVQSAEELRRHWGEAVEVAELVVYCGSGVTACVNLWSLSRLGREDAVLYAGSWSDWCSYL